MSVVLDASSVLAILFDEAGADVAVSQARGALLSAVNLTEVLEKFARATSRPELAEGLLERLELVIVPFDAAQARVAAELKERLGRNISLADRACLALGIVRSAQVLTGDRIWAGFDLGLDIRLIR